MRIMGLDPSTKFGVAVVETGKKVIYTEQVEFKKETGVPRISMLVARVMELHAKHKPDLVVIESMFVGHPSSAIPIISLGSILRYFLWQEDILHLEVGPTILKKFVSGSGAAKKDQMMMFVLKNWGYESKTDNIADAVGLGMFGLCCANETFSVDARKTCETALKTQPEVRTFLSALK